MQLSAFWRCNVAPLYTGLCGYIGVASMIVLDSGTPVECVTIEIMGLGQDTVCAKSDVTRQQMTFLVATRVFP